MDICSEVKAGTIMKCKLWFMRAWNICRPPVNQSPTADAGAPYSTFIDGDSNGWEYVTLDGTNSFDADGSITNYLWKQDGILIATGMTVQVQLNLGTNTIKLTDQPDL